MRNVSSAMHWGDWSVAEGVKFVKDKLGKEATKQWSLADFFAVLGEEAHHQEVVTTRYGSYTITIERFVSSKKPPREALAKAGVEQPAIKS
jgi:hypothetical protein